MDDRTLDTLVRAAAEDARASLGPHRSPEELIAYHAGELERTASEAVQEHLALCRECTALVLAAEEFMETDEAGAAAADAPGVGPGHAAPARTASVPRGWAYSGWAVAATVLVVAGVWLGPFRGRAGSGPEANVPVLSLLPLAPDDRERGEVAPETVPERVSSILLILAVPDASLPPPGRAEFVVAGAAGQPVLTIPGLVPNAEGSVTLLVPLRRLPAGTYVVRLFGAAPSEKPVAEYALRLSPP